MFKIFLFTLSFLILLSCRRKHAPERTLPETSVTSNVIIPKKSDSVVVRKKVYKPTKKDIIPDVIVVNEKSSTQKR